MAYRTKAYMLKEEIREDSTKYFIGFKDRQGKYHELGVSPVFMQSFGCWNWTSAS